jgi:hypothetical protein
MNKQTRKAYRILRVGNLMKNSQLENQEKMGGT